MDNNVTQQKAGFNIHVPFVEHLGIRILEKSEGLVKLRLDPRPELLNSWGSVHGGVLMAFADHGLSMLAWEAAERAPCTTIQLNTHFLDAITPGEFLDIRGEVTRRTRGLVFVRGVITARGADAARDVGAIDGIWRVLRTR